MSDSFIHKTAVIDKGAKIGKGTRIWHFTHVSSIAVVGDNVTLGQNVFVGNNVFIGNNCKIQNNISIYDNVYLEDNVFCGPSMVFTNVINPRSAINRSNEFKDTRVKKGATLGANCTIICGVTIGNYAFIGAGAVVTKNIKPYALVVGVPAKQIGWMSEFGETLDIPLTGSGSAICSHTGFTYQLKDGHLTKVSGQNNAV